MKYIIQEIPCCMACPLYEYNRDEGVHWCGATEMILEVDKNTIDPDCPLSDSRDNAG